MAKKSAIAKNKKRERMVAKYAAVRSELKKILSSPDTTDDEFVAAQKKLDQLPKNSAPARLRNRCKVTGRPRGYFRKFGLSRLTVRELALDGKLPGVMKSSW